MQSFMYFNTIIQGYVDNRQLLLYFSWKSSILLIQSSETEIKRKFVACCTLKRKSPEDLLHNVS